MYTVPRQPYYYGYGGYGYGPGYGPGGYAQSRPGRVPPGAYVVPQGGGPMNPFVQPLSPTTLAASQEPTWTQYLIKKENRQFDFQTVARDTPTEHRFIIKNPFVETVRIANVSSSCFCTTAFVDGKEELQTYEERAIVAQFHTDRFEGPKNATITVVIDKPYYAEFQLNVRGVIRTDLSITPKNVVFGPIKEGAEVSRTLNVVYTGPFADWKIVDFKCSNKHLSGQVVKVDSRPGQLTSQVKIVLDDQAPKGELNERFLLISNDVESRREIPIIVRGTVGTVIRIAPQNTFLGHLEPGEPSSLKTVVLVGTKPFRIEKIECDNPAIEIKPTPDPDASPKGVYSFTVQYKNPKEGPGAPKEGKMSTVVRIQTDDPGLTPSFNVTMQTAEAE